MTVNRLTVTGMTATRGSVTRTACLRLRRSIRAAHAPVLAACLAVLLLPASSAGQDLQFSGYVSALPAWQRFPYDIDGTRSAGTALLRTRLRAQAEPWEGGLAAVEYELSALASTLAMPLASSERARRQWADLTWAPVNRGGFGVRHTVDRLLVQHDAGPVRIALGRQRIAWGTGRIWNPTDVFHPINPAAWDKIEKDGADALTVRVSPGQFTDVTAVLNPSRDGTLNGAVRARGNAFEFDASLVGGMFDRRVVAGGDLAGNLGTAGVRAEVLVSLPRDGGASSFARAVAGLDYQWTAELYTLIEYQFNGEGSGNRARYDLERLASGEILNVGRHYACAAAMLQAHPLLGVSLTLLSSLTDGSGFGSAAATWSATDETLVATGLLLPWGTALSEYSFYPRAVYARVEWHF